MILAHRLDACVELIRSYLDSCASGEEVPDAAHPDDAAAKVAQAAGFSEAEIEAAWAVIDA